MIQRGMPTVSAKGAKMGMASTAKPLEEGTTKPSTKKMSSRHTTNRGPLMPATRLEAAFSMVSLIMPSVSTWFTPRARPMMSATGTRLEAPAPKASTIFASPTPSLPVPPMNITRMDSVTNSAAICGNHQPRFMTPTIMMMKAATKMTSTIFLRRLNSRAAAPLSSSSHWALNFSRSS